MKKLAIALTLFVLVLVAIGINLSRASREPLVTTPDPLQVGRAKLHDQLVQSEQREAGIEKQDWNSVALLRELIDAHQKRIDELSGNTEAGDIVTHDRDAIARLEKRIQDLAAIESKKPTEPPVEEKKAK